MELKDTIELMTSDDFKERFIAEYAQLAIRANGLESMLQRAEKGTLPFKLKPRCSLFLLQSQLNTMKDYVKQLEIRAEIEGIELPVI